MTDPLDLGGAALAALSFGAMTFALVEAGSRGFGDTRVVATLAGSVASLGAFVWYERRVAKPLVPPELLRRRNFTVGNLETLLVYGALYASTFLLVLYLQAIGFSPFATVLLSLPNGHPRPGTYYIQGLIRDAQAPGLFTFAATNAILKVVH